MLRCCCACSFRSSPRNPAHRVHYLAIPVPFPWSDTSAPTCDNMEMPFLCRWQRNKRNNWEVDFPGRARRTTLFCCLSSSVRGAGTPPPPLDRRQPLLSTRHQSQTYEWRHPIVGFLHDRNDARLRSNCAYQHFLTNFFHPIRCQR